MKPNQNGFRYECELDCLPVHDTDRDRTKEVVDACGGLGQANRINASSDVRWDVCDIDICEFHSSLIPNAEDHLDLVSIGRALS